MSITKLLLLLSKLRAANLAIRQQHMVPASIIVVAFVLVGMTGGALGQQTVSPSQSPDGNAETGERREAAHAGAEVFFTDTFADAFGGVSPLDRARKPRLSTPVAEAHGDASASSMRWSKALDAELLEDELKRILQVLQRETRTASRFSQTSRRELTAELATAALVLKILSEWDGQHRFRDRAGVVAGLLCSELPPVQQGGPGAWEAAARATEHLNRLMLGEHAWDPSASIPEWSACVDRRLTMQRLDQAMESRFREALSNAAVFARSRAGMAREANLTAGVLGALLQEGLEDAHDPSYVELCKQAAKQAIVLKQAANQNDYARAQTAFRRLDDACHACHDQYR